MSKIDNSIIENLRVLSMQKETSKEVQELCYLNAPIIYNLYTNHLNINMQDINWPNQDRIVVTNKILPLFYAMLHHNYKEMSLENIREYAMYSSSTPGIAKISTKGVMASSIINGDVIGSSIGITLGERYIESLIKIESPKCDLINFNTYCLCTSEDFKTSIAYESLQFLKSQKLKKIIFIILACNEDKSIGDLASLYDMNYEAIKVNDITSFNNAIKDAKSSKKPSVILIKNNSRNDLNISLREIDEEEDLQAINEYQKIVSKRMSKVINKWQNVYNECNSDLKIKEIIKFLNNGVGEVPFKIDNIKINDNYLEELLLSNSKIFNLLANKSPFILSCSDKDFHHNHTDITKSSNMDYNNPSSRNIYFANYSLALSSVSIGLAYLGFKVFISTDLCNLNNILPFIKLSIINKLNCHFIFTNDTFINSSKYNLPVLDELDTLKNLPDLITFRPCDINEVIGVYDIVSKYNEPTCLVLGNKVTPKMKGTQSKFVAAGAYPVLKEESELNAVIIASGSEVNYALKLADELVYYGILLRVVSMPSEKLFNRQTERYRNALLPREVKTFYLEFSTANSAYHFVKDKDYILNIPSFVIGGNKEEVLNAYNLNNDALKARIIELMKK